MGVIYAHLERDMHSIVLLRSDSCVCIFHKFCRRSDRCLISHVLAGINMIAVVANVERLAQMSK